MKATNYPVEVQKALLESLTNQKSPKTPAEVNLLSELRDIFAEECEVDGYNKTDFKRVGNYIKMADMDTFGEDYRNKWVKIKSNSKGEYFTIKYLGNNRIYIY